MTNPFISILNSYLPEPQASLLNGILFGTKASMPPDFYQALITTGVLHMIALSGMNISILASITANTFFFAGKRKSMYITIFLIFAFILLVGPSPSIVRAGIMGLLTLVAFLTGKKNWGIYSLFIAAGIMFVFDMSLIGNLSFQLSFLATLGIILFGGKGSTVYKRYIKERLPNRILLWFMQNMKTTLAAQVFTVPLICWNFHRISLIAPITNLLLEWTIQPLMILGFAAGIFGLIFWPLGIFPAWGAWVFLTYFIKVVEVMSKIPGASIEIPYSP